MAMIRSITYRVGGNSARLELRRETLMSRERVNVDPDAPQGHETYGTRRTLFGRRVVEVHSELYLSEDIRFEAVRYSSFIGMPRGGWLVCPRFNGESSDPIATKREAIELLAEWSAEHAAKSASR